MTRKSRVISSSHKSLIDDLFSKSYRVSGVLEILREKGIDVSRSALYRYKNSHFVSRRQPVTRLYNILVETGNSNLVRSLEKTLKVYRTHKKCLCDNLLPQDLRRSGRIFLHKLCNGWVCYNIAVNIKNRNKRGKSPRKYYRVSVTARSY